MTIETQKSLSDAQKPKAPLNQAARSLEVFMHLVVLLFLECDHRLLCCVRLDLPTDGNLRA
jgi:hypothetical protein